MAIDTTYQLQPGESIAAYTARIANYNASKTPAPVTPTPTPTSTPAPVAPPPTPSAVDKNYFLNPGESTDAYNARIATYNASKVPAQVDVSGVTASAPTLPTPSAPSVLNSYVAGVTAQADSTRNELDQRYKAEQARIEQQMKDTQAEIDALTAKQEDILKSGGSVDQLTQPFREELEASERERLKVEENYFANQQAVGELDSLLTEGNQLIEQMKGETGLASIRNPRITEATNAIAARAGVIQAVMAARNSQISVAGNLIDRTVSTIAADRNDQLSYWNSVLSFYASEKKSASEDFASLSSDQKKYIEAQIGLVQEKHDQAQKTADYVKELLVNPQSAALLQQAGVTLNDSVETINAKLSQASYQQEVVNLNNKMAASGYKYILPGQTPPAGTQAITVQDSRGKSYTYYTDKQAATGIVGEYQYAVANGYKGTFTQYQNEDANRKQKAITPGSVVAPGDDPQLYSGLSSATAAAVRAKVNQFKSEPTIQNFAVVQEGKNFASSISNTTTNPADDQALIYALAKALDPGSVVREGEYATAQKYAQSWISAYGKGVEQAILGTGFLSETARTNIKKTIEQKFAASKVSYDNLYGKYAANIGALTGRGDGTRFLTDYQTPAPSSAPSTPTLSNADFFASIPGAATPTPTTPNPTPTATPTPSQPKIGDLSNVDFFSFLK